MKLSDRLKAEHKFVEAALGASVICERCKATLGTFADACKADLSDTCPGFEAIEEAKGEFQQQWQKTKSL